LTTTDMTDRARMESELRRLAAVVDFSADAILTTDLGGKITSWNRGAERIHGYASSEIVGEPVRVLISAGRAGEEQAILERVLRGEVVERYQTQRLAKDGRVIDVSITLSPIRGGSGRVTGASCVYRDVTEQNRTEREIRTLNARLTREISERRASEAKIQRAKEEAERANRAKSEFLSRMSHELRTPLHAILGFGELLERDDLMPSQREKLVQITKGARHLLALINEALDLTAIERGELKVSIEPVHAGELVKETLEIIAPLAAARSLRVAWTATGFDVHVLADHQRLKQVLLNLLSNAVKYNRERGEVKLGCTRRDSNMVRIEVGDGGDGIAPANLARVFEPFERLGAETTDVEGAGLGLALTKRLVEAMGGRIGVASELGHGTTFWVELAVVAAPQALRSPTDPDDRRVSAPRIRGPVRTVLYIEDNPSNIRLVETILAERPEVTLLVSSQGMLGLDLAREHQPSLVLLDLNLPDISGEDVLRRIRNDPRMFDLPVVMLSADATPSHVKHLRHLGADDYLTKPFGFEQFMRVIDGFAASDHDRVEPAEETESAIAPAVLEPGAIERLHELANRSEVGPRAIREMVAIFVSDLLERIGVIEAATREEDLAVITFQAHAVAGASGSIGAAQLMGVCRELEARAKQLDIEGTRSVVSGLAQASADACAALEAEFCLPDAETSAADSARQV
jgi:PAS domain S-box-containing protein